MIIKVLELFGGIGACSNALKQLNISFEIVDYVEIDTHAVKSFNAIYNTNFVPQDIKNWDKELQVDLIMHGSPCQDFSIVGKQAGGDEKSGTMSSLMYETIRIVEKLKPKYVIWENVKNLLNKKHKSNFDNYISRLNELGYKSYYQVLNAKDYGIPQNRSRVFTISIRNNLKQTFVFPKKQELKLKLKDLLENEVDGKYYLSNKMVNYVLSSGTKKFITSTKIDLDIARPILKTMHYMHRAGVDNYVTHNSKIRRLTPKECWRLMGFSDEDFEKAKRVNSDTQLYRQAGNSIVVNVLVEIFNNLFVDYSK